MGGPHVLRERKARPRGDARAERGDGPTTGVFGVCGRVRVSVCPERPRASAGTTGPSRVSFMVSLCHVEVGGCERGGQVVQLGLSLGKGAWRQNFLRLRHALKRSSGSRCAGALRAFAAR